MKRMIVTAAIAATLACSHLPPQVQLVCRHKAVACGLAMGEEIGRENVMIAVGPGIDTVQWHAQAYTTINGETVWISTDTTDFCKPTKQSDKFMPRDFFTIEQFIREHIRYAPLSGRDR